MKRMTIPSVLVLLAMVLAACGGAAAPAATTAPAAATEAPAATTAPAATMAMTSTSAMTPTTAMTATTAMTSTGTTGTTAGESEAGARAVGLDFLADAYAGKYKGDKVTMTGPFVDQDAVKFNNSMQTFESKTGITIEYEGSKEFEASISARVQAGDAPDMRNSQPGLLGTFARQGKVVAADKLIPMSWLKQNYIQSWLDIPTMPGPDGNPMLAGIVQRFNGKDLVWYPKAAFDAAGYKIPTTWDDMMKLTQQIADDGDTAWCIGIGSGAATGWPATDWIEAVLLRTAPLSDYDNWVLGKLKFDSPRSATT